VLLSAQPSERRFTVVLVLQTEIRRKRDCLPLSLILEEPPETWWIGCGSVKSLIFSTSTWALTIARLQRSGFRDYRGGALLAATLLFHPALKEKKA